MKPFLSSIDKKTDDKSITWNPKHSEAFDGISKFNLPEFQGEGDDKHLIETNHFILQQINIPRKDGGVPSFRRLMQIALNIGQFISAVDEDVPKEVQGALLKYNMVDINTYMTEENYSKYDFQKEDLVELKKILEELQQNPPLIK